MSESRTTSILERVPAILAVTANSYGLSMQSGTRKPEAAGERRRNASGKGGEKPAAQR
jgi:hypothetical protein